jgi:hypothetical protein
MIVKPYYLLFCTAPPLKERGIARNNETPLL